MIQIYDPEDQLDPNMDPKGPNWPEIGLKLGSYRFTKYIFGPILRSTRPFPTLFLPCGPKTTQNDPKIDHTSLKFRYSEKATKSWLIFHFLFDITNYLNSSIKL